MKQKEQARHNRIVCMRRKLVESVRQMDSPRVAQECLTRSFVYGYVDKEKALTCEEEKAMKVARTKDSLPFGMNIRNAAHKATFGVVPNALSRYLPSMDQKNKKSKLVDKRAASQILEELDDIFDDSSSDSVSKGSSDASSLDLDSIEVTDASASKG